MSLKVLAEKLNVQGEDRDSMPPAQKATACLKSVCEGYDKVSEY